MTTATVNFSETDDGLFTPEEIRQLMRLEYDRARRYRYPASLLLVAVDRLESLQDLYGWESKEEILQAVIKALRATTRDSDFLGCMHDGRILTVFPHTDEKAITSIATRLLGICRALDFRTDGRALRATVSIGAAILVEDSELEFEHFVEIAEEAVTFALASGGDRFVRREAADDVIDRLRDEIDAEADRLVQDRIRIQEAAERETSAPEIASPLTPPILGTRPHSGDAADSELAKAIAAVFRDGSADPFALEADILAIAEEHVRREREAAVSAALAEHGKQVDLLERRVRKLKGLLDETGAELSRIATLKGLDSGIASIYRTVQGLSPDEDRLQEKREMLTLIFEANLDLQKKKRRS